MSEAPKSELKRAVVMTEARMQLAEQWRQDWVVNAEEGTTINDVLDAAYWAHVSRKFQMLDRIEVRMETGAWIVELVVLQTGMNWAKVALLQHYDFEGETQEAPRASAHEVVWRGAQHKFAVKRVADKAVVQQGFPTRDEAMSWMKNYETTTLAS